MGLYNDLPDNSYIKQVLQGVDEDFCERFLEMLKKYRATKDATEKREYRDRLTSLFWELFSMIAIHISDDFPTAKKLFIRYGLVDLRSLTPEDQKYILSQANDMVNYEEETVFYLDEWLLGIANGQLKPSSGDETKSKAADLPVTDKTEKHLALIDVEQRRFDDFRASRANFLYKMASDVELLQEEFMEQSTRFTGVYTVEQINALENIAYYQKEIKKLNKDIFSSATAMRKAHDTLESLRIEEAYLNSAQIGTSQNNEALQQEIANIRQMAKMTVGRQGNAFPLLTSGFMPKETKEYLFKNIVKRKLNRWMNLDPEVFYRTYKNETISIQPYMILIPGYGTTGACWEPLDKNNKQFSKGRIVLPIFSRAPDLSLLTALGDNRWQLAKETSFYWMEEGITGNYYSYFLDAKLKGDMRLSFISDYVLWMTKETQGIQKLEQDARYVFWRYVPLPDEDKIKLSQKGYYYAQLWEKEQVWRRAGKY